MRRMGTSALGLLHTRVELFAVELQEEKLRAMQLLVWLSVAVALGVASILVAVGALALFFWQTAGYAGLIGLAVVTFAAAAGIFWMLRHRILSGESPFAETAAEFRRDLECLHREE
ncbi:MAG: phage holin family protein [Opitutaceae bacterium]